MPIRFRKTLWVFNLLISIGIIAAGVNNILVFHGFYADGAFQILNPLRRIDAGLPIEFFHGKGIPYLHYPFYVLFGRTIFASEIARNVLSIAAFFCTSLTVVHACFSDTGMRRLVLFVLLLYGYINIYAVGGGLVLPGNSLLGLRGTIPLLTFALVYSSRIQGFTKSIALGICLGLSMVMSTEQGIALIIAWSTAQFMFFALARWKRQRVVLNKIISLLSTILVAVITVFGTLSILSNGFSGALATLDFNVLQVTKDQFWYFGTPPHYFISRPTDLLQLSFMAPLLIFVLIIFTIVRDTTRSNVVRSPEVFAGLLMLSIYGLLSATSYFGYQVQDYLSTWWRTIIITVCILIWNNEKRSSYWLKILTLKSKLLYITTYLLFFSFSVSAALVIISSLGNDAGTLNKSGPLSLDDKWSSYIEQVSSRIDQKTMKDGHTPTLWGTYTGLIHAKYHTFNLSKYDYIIHALGPEKRAEGNQPQIRTTQK